MNEPISPDYQAEKAWHGADLHTHSSYSDGTDSPREIVRKAAESGLSMIGLTDHDSISGWQEAYQAGKEAGILVVRGMEMTTTLSSLRQKEGKSHSTFHLLAYLFNPQDPQLKAHMRAQREGRSERAQKIVERLSKDVPLTWQMVTENVSEGAMIGRPHIADALIKAGIVETRQEAFERFLGVHSPYFVDRPSTPLLQAIEWIKQAGGVCVLAHPFADVRGRKITEKELAAAKEAGLFGVEVEHGDHSMADREELSRLSRRFHLAQCGSSDYHGRGKPYRIGQYTTAKEVVDGLIHGRFLQV